jgi:large repetitive protein
LHAGQTGTDSFTYQVSDGHGGFDTATARITIHGSNTRPDLDAGSVSSLNLNNALQTNVDTTINITDPDNTTMQSAKVAITDGFHQGDMLIFTDQNGIHGSYDQAHGVLTLTGSSSTANYENALESVQFSPADGAAAVLDPREFTFTVNDGHLNSLPDSASQATIDLLLV